MRCICYYNFKYCIINYASLRAYAEEISSFSVDVRCSKMSTIKILLLMTCIQIFVSLPTALGSSAVDGVCLPGSKHKAKPTPEDSSYKACHVFKNSSCCTSEFTNQLAQPVVQGIRNFSWTRCGNLSAKCQEYMIGVECFYSCSPYVGLWADPVFPSAFNNAPVCSSYCDEWYEACKDQPTCAKNWVFDFNETPDGHNLCKRNCTTFKEFYANGKELCEIMWHKSFKYVNETENKGRCLHFRYDNRFKSPNIEVVENLFGSTVAPTSTPTSQAMGLHHQVWYKTFACQVLVAFVLLCHTFLFHLQRL